MRTQVNKIINQRGNITTDTTEIERIIRNYWEQFYANKLDNLKEIDKFLETYTLPRLNHKEIENLLIQSSIQESKKFPVKKRKRRHYNWYHRNSKDHRGYYEQL